MFTLNCRGTLVVIDQPLVMGIINATSDSFFRGDLSNGVGKTVELAGRMLADGADILDIGAQSTAPGAPTIAIDEEMNRLLPVLEAIRTNFPSAILSVDTSRSTVAAAALGTGVHIVNDVTGGCNDPEILNVTASAKAPFICMHMRGTPDTMQGLTQYNDILKEMLDYFVERLQACKKAGIMDVVLDPGFGFAKTAEQNLFLLKNLETFGILDRPILAGLSRKSTIYRTLGVTVNEALNGTTVLNTLALNNGASILRVHDVREAKEAVTLMEKYSSAAPNFTKPSTS